MIAFITDGPIPVGKMNVNGISKLMKIGGTAGSLVNPSLADLDYDSDKEDESSGKYSANKSLYHPLYHIP